MPLETGTYINSLVASSPAATDALSVADDHLRLIKSTIKNSFPGIAGAVNATHAELNILDGGTAATATTLVDADRIVINDGGTMVQVSLSDLGTYLGSNLAVTSSMLADGTIQAADIADGAITQAKLSSNVTLIPTGVLVPYAGSTAPSGYLMCYGQLVNRTQYPDLYAAIGDTYGAGDGSTTFSLPDLRGRTVAGQDDMGGTAASRLSTEITGTTLGAAGGSETHALTEAELAAHRHFAVKQGSRGPTGGTVALTDSNSIIRYSIDPDYSQPQENATSYSLEGLAGDADIGRTSATGSGTGHNNMQPTIVLNYIIKT